jgi:hypothetical protein
VLGIDQESAGGFVPLPDVSGWLIFLQVEQNASLGKRRPRCCALIGDGLHPQIAL